jgi:hypothetical protein
VVLYGLGLVKDEGDVLEESILHALSYCDRLFYMDNGSTDDSWSIIQALADDYPGRVIAFEQSDEPYLEGMRNRIVNEVAGELGSHGWWVKLDADEFLDADPRPAISAAMLADYDSIRCWQVQFAYTDVDLAAWQAGEDDPSRPIQQRRRYYESAWREVRLWRNRPTEQWHDVTRSHPEFIGRPSREILFNRHYQYRDPQQIEHRLELRHGDRHFPHEPSADWRSVVRPAAELTLSVDGQPWHHSRFRYYRSALPSAIRSRTEAAARLITAGGS